ncbi:MAG: ABC transporter substrate-binding protein [Candidatus Aramenus sp.]|nr:ABC transporter substrate-binding protein [Candidatus Aramenus sp.]
MVKVYSEVLDDYVEVPRPVRKVVSLDPASTETIFMLGHGDKVIATDAFSYRPEEARRLPKIGSYTHVKEEFLEENKPDVIFTTMGAQKELTKALIKKGYTVYPMPVATSVGKILDNVIVVGEVIGEYEKARELYQSLLLKVLQNLSTSANVKVYVEFDLGGPITPGFPTHVSDAIRIAGGRNVFDDRHEAYFEPDPKEVLRKNPDVVVYEPKRLTEYEKERFAKSLRSRGLDFLLNKRVFFTKGDFLAHQGPSFILEAIPWLRSIFSS